MLFKKKKNEIHLSDKKLLSNLQKKRLPSLDQIKHIGKFLNSIEKVIISIITITILASIAYMANNYYQTNSEVVAADGGTLIEGMLGKPAYINPILASNNSSDDDISRLIYSGLLKYNENLELIPDLAETYQLSEDNKTYTFTLKPEIYFHDEQPLTVDDVIYTYSLIQNLEYKSPLYSNFAGVQITRIDDRTVSFTLTDVYAPFEHFFTTGILPSHIWENVAPQNFPLAQHNIKPIGSGPYKFDKLLKDANGNIITYKLSRFENYYGIKAHIENITLKFFVDIQPAIDALINGQINSLGNIPHQEMDYTANNDNIQTHRLDLPQYTALFFNPKKNTELANTSLRKALSLAINKDEIINNIFADNVTVIHGPILPGFPGYDENLPSTDYNLEEAKTLLTDNGWKYNDDDYLIKSDSSTEDTEESTESESTEESTDEEKAPSGDLTIKVTVANNEDSLSLANAIKDSWAELGVITELNIVDINTIKEIIKERDYDAILYGESLGADPDLFPFWHSTQVEYPGLNLAQFTNKQADTLIEEARQSTDSLSRESKYSELQKLIIEEYPAVFLYEPKYIYALNTDVHNYNNTKLIRYADRWNDIYKLYIKTSKKFKW